MLWSTGGAGIKLLQDALSPLATSGGRSFVCAFVFLAFLRGRIAVPRAELVPFAVSALSYVLVVTGFVLATRMTTAANAILLQYTAPMFIALWNWLRGLRPSAFEFAAMGLGFVGVLFCLGGGGSQTRGELALLGDAIALASGVAFAATTLALRTLNRLHEGAPAGAPSPTLLSLFWGNALTALIASPWLLEAARGAEAMSKPALVAAVLLWLGVVQLGGGYWFFQRGLRSTAPLAASLICLAEPVLNPVWVWFAIQERPHLGTLIGGTCVLGAIALTAMAPRRDDAKP